MCRDICKNTDVVGAGRGVHPYKYDNKTRCPPEMSGGHRIHDRICSVRVTQAAERPCACFISSILCFSYPRDVANLIQRSQSKGIQGELRGEHKPQLPYIHVRLSHGWIVSCQAVLILACSPHPIGPGLIKFPSSWLIFCDYSG